MKFHIFLVYVCVCACVVGASVDSEGIGVFHVLDFLIQKSRFSLNTFSLTLLWMIAPWKKFCTISCSNPALFFYGIQNNFCHQPQMPLPLLQKRHCWFLVCPSWTICLDNHLLSISKNRSCVYILSVSSYSCIFSNLDSSSWVLLWYYKSLIVLEKLIWKSFTMRDL